MGKANQGSVSFRLAAEVCYFWDLQPEMESITGMSCRTRAEGMNLGQNGTIQIDILRISICSHLFIVWLCDDKSI